MAYLSTKCSKISDTGFCPYFNSRNIIKNGHTSTGKRQYCYKNCKKRFLDYYTYKAYEKDTDHNIVALLKEGGGIRSTARLLKISSTTVIRKIKRIAKEIKRPVISIGKSYEIDEMCTFVKKRKSYLDSICSLSENWKGSKF